VTKNETAIAGANERYLRISLGQEEYAIPLLRVREVIAVPEVTPIPQTPNYFQGVINLRGQVITVVDMRTKLGIKPLDGPEKAVVICDLGAVSLGLVVDSINSVATPKAEELSERPDLRNQKAMEYITAVYRHERGMVLLVDITKLFNFDDQSVAAKAGAKAA
jgi:purine-binding chemotaxis protein CheW